MVKENKMVQTEIGLLPEEWEVVNLGEVVKIFSGNSFKSSDAQELGIRWLKIANVGLNRVEWNDESFLPKSFYNIYKDYVLNKGDIVIALTRPLLGLKLKIAEIKDNDSPSLLNQRVGKIETDLNKKFVYYLFQSNIFLQKLNDSMLGTDPPNMSVNIVYKFQIPLPSLPEQEAIASALSDADAWIKSLEQLIAKKCLIKQGAMQELLTPKEDWEVKKLGEVATILGGGTPSTFVSEYWNGKIEWFTPTEVGYSKYLYSSKRKISKLGFKNASANLLPKNSILLTTRAGIGDLGILKIEACTNQGFQSIVCNENIDFEFIYYLMSTKKDDLLRNASGSTFLEISPSKVKSLEIQIPSLPEQTRIATILSDMDAELEALDIQLEKAKKIKQGMMQELLTGRIRLV